MGVAARPHSSDARLNRTRPIANTRRRPKRSAERARREQHRGEHQRVGVHDPLEVGEAGVQLSLDVRQRHVHHRDVQQQHEGAEAYGQQGPALGAHPGVFPDPRRLRAAGGQARATCHHPRRMFGGSSIQLARVFGIRIGVDASWFFVLFLIIWSFSGDYADLFPGEDGKAFALATVTRAPVLRLDRPARAGARGGRDAQRDTDLGHRPVAVRRRGEARARHRLARRGVPRGGRGAAGDAGDRGDLLRRGDGAVGHRRRP